MAEASQIDRETGRELRRVMRSAQKLRRFWEAPPETVPPDHGDFRTRVDIALGVAAWRPLLEIARHGLEVAPDPELFDDAKERFRVVTGDRWMEETSFEEWQAQQR